METRIYAIALAVIGIVIGFVQTTAVKLSLYFTLPWLDIPMHFLGGLWVGIAILYFLRIADTPWSFVFPLVVGSVLTIGILWEFLEVFLGLYIAEQNILGDTVLDLIMDTVGGFGAYFFARSIVSMIRRR